MKHLIDRYGILAVAAGYIAGLTVITLAGLAIIWLIGPEFTLAGLIAAAAVCNKSM